jgi:hypothetical protein
MEADKVKYIEKAVEWIHKRKIQSFAVNHEGYDQPKPFLNQRTNENICPDLSYIDERGNQIYVEIAIKQDDLRTAVTKWKLLTSLAAQKSGKLYLLCPKGHLSFIQKQVTTYGLSAIINSI